MDWGFLTEAERVTGSPGAACSVQPKTQQGPSRSRGHGSRERTERRARGPRVILEGIVTSVSPDGRLNIAPMGPRSERTGLSRFELRPYRSSTTYQNLKAQGGGYHVTDDVLLLAEARSGPDRAGAELLRPGASPAGSSPAPAVIPSSGWWTSTSGLIGPGSLSRPSPRAASGTSSASTGRGMPWWRQPSWPRVFPSSPG